MESIDDPKEARELERVHIEIPVELGYGDFEDSFEADALNLSRGGLSMSSGCLPDVGARLLCRFVCGSSGATVTAHGEVVWAQCSDGRRGEFGMCFVDLDPETEFMIEEMIAEHAAHASPGEGPDEFAAPVTKLELEGSPEPIQARLARSSHGQAVFEQELDLLSLGRAVYARELADGEQRGSISGVELRMMGNVPTLAVTVAFDGPGSFGEYDLDGHSDDAEPHDTEPDLAAPAGRSGAQPAAASTVEAARFAHTTMNEFEADGVERAAGSDSGSNGWTWGSSADGAQAVDTAEPLPDSELVAALMTEEPGTPDHVGAELDEVLADGYDRARMQPQQVELALPGASGDHDAHTSDQLPTPLSTVAPELVEAARADIGASQAGREVASAEQAGREVASAEQTGRELDSPALVAAERAHAAPSVELRPAAKSSESTGYDPFEPDPFMPPSAAMQAQQWMRGAAARGAAIGLLVLARMRPLLGKAAPRLRGLWIALRGSSVGALRSHVAPTFGTLRRLVTSQVIRKRRRTTAQPGVTPRRRSAAAARTLGLGLLGAGAVALGVYALAPEQAGDGLDLHRTVKPPTDAPAPRASGSPASVLPSGTPGVGAAGLTDEAVPSAQAVPAASPFAVDVREGGVSVKPTPSAGRFAEFGAAQVEGGRTFKLRMSAPVNKLEGIPDKGGFTVIVPGSLSLDRAGPISAAHRSVRRSMILNKGSRSELTIRFEEGKRPAYRVVGEGQSLNVTIGD